MPISSWDYTNYLYSFIDVPDELAYLEDTYGELKKRANKQDDIMTELDKDLKEITTLKEKYNGLQRRLTTEQRAYNNMQNKLTQLNGKIQKYEDTKSK